MSRMNVTGVMLLSGLWFALSTAPAGAALLSGTLGDATPSLVYHANNGSLSIDTDGAPLLALDIMSQAGLFNPFAATAGFGGINISTRRTISQPIGNSTTIGDAGYLNSGMSEAFLLSDLTFSGRDQFNTPFTGDLVYLSSNAAPTADAGGSYTIEEGEGLLLDGSGSSDPDAGDGVLVYYWDFGNDGFAEVVTLDALTLLVAEEVALYTGYLGPGNYDLSLKVLGGSIVFDEFGPQLINGELSGQIDDSRNLTSPADVTTLTITEVPEPASVVLLVAGVALLLRRRDV